MSAQSPSASWRLGLLKISTRVEAVDLSSRANSQSGTTNLRFYQAWDVREHPGSDTTKKVGRSLQHHNTTQNGFIEDNSLAQDCSKIPVSMTHQMSCQSHKQNQTHQSCSSKVSTPYKLFMGKPSSTRAGTIYDDTRREATARLEGRKKKDSSDTCHISSKNIPPQGQAGSTKHRSMQIFSYPTVISGPHRADTQVGLPCTSKVLSHFTSLFILT